MLICLAGGRGAFESCEILLRQVKKDTGHVYVVVNNQPDYPAVELMQSLQQNSELPVQLVSGSTLIVRNHIYLAPANSNLKVIDHHFTLDDNNPRSSPLDIFMHSMADQYPGKIMAIILSGAENDGVEGLKKIKARKGLVVVQDPKETAFRELPEQCIRAGVSDQVLEIKALEKLITSPLQKSSKKNSTHFLHEEEQVIFEIMTLLKSRYHFDFTKLKPFKIMQTLQRRMKLMQIEDINAFQQLLQKNHKISNAIYQDIFFRKNILFDSSIAFSQLESQILPDIIKRKVKNDSIRCWILGCASGEDAYSLSILINEALINHGLSLDCKIFATDINEDYLQLARKGGFGNEIAKQLSKNRISNHFIRSENKYKVNTKIREPLIFSRYNIFSDPPFTHLDLVICPHFIVNFKKEVQQQILELLHFSLQTDGTLLLSFTESAIKSPFFKHQQNSIFHKTNSKSKPVLHQKGPPGIPVAEPERQNTINFEQIHKNLLFQYSKASILISQDGEIFHASPMAGMYLNYHSGSITRNLVTLIRKELILHLKKALVAEHKKGEVIRSPAVKMKLDGQLKWITLCSMNAEYEQDGYLLIVFEEEKVFEKEKTARTRDENHQNLPSQSELQAELKEKKQQLEFIIREDHEKQQSLQAANTKLQKLLEELEINKQELQSINEELISLNYENIEKLSELQEVSNELQNVLNATDVALLFLTRDLRILKFTPALTKIFNVLNSDKGRFFRNLSVSNIYPDFIDNAIQVLENLTSIDREFKHQDGRWILVRLIPYRNTEEYIEGVAINFIDISNIKHAEEALKISNERFGLVAKATNDVIRDLDLRTNKIWWNPAINKQFGYSIDTLNSDLEWWMQNIHPDDREMVGQTLKQSIDHKDQNWNNEYRFKCADGDYAFVLDRGYLIFDGEGNPIRMLGSMLDITERKKTEEVLKQNENRLKTYTEAMPQIAFMADRNGGITYWNKRWFEYIGDKKATEGWGWKTKNVLHPEDLESTIQRWLFSIKTGHDYEIEYRLKRHDGMYRWHLSRAVPVYDQNGIIEMWLGTNTDIHHYKTIQETLKANEANLRKIMDNLSMATRAAKLGWGNWDMVKDEAIWDDRALEILGLNDPSGSLADFFEVIHPDDRNQFQLIIQECFEHQRQFDLEYRVVHPNQEIRFVHGSGEFVFADDGTPLMGTGLIRDITERKLLQQQKDDFLAIASHEMKTPVAVMKGYVALIKKLLVKKGNTQEVNLVERVDDQIKRLTHLINDLLDVTRLESGRMKFDEEVFDFDNLVKEVVNSMQHISSHQLICTANSSQKVKGDRERTGQVIINFISNAIKYSPEAKEIMVDCWQEDDEVVAQVKDFGIGINLEDQDKLFDRFFRVRPTGHKDSGLGLGLYISAEIIHRQNGSVWVESKQNEGSVFGFRLPVVGNSKR